MEKFCTFFDDVIFRRRVNFVLNKEENLNENEVSVEENEVCEDIVKGYVEYPGDIEQGSLLPTGIVKVC